MAVNKKIAAPRFRPTTRKSDRPVYSRWPIGLRETFAALNELPLALLGLSSSSLGGLVLWTYFKSVGYIPDDVVSLLGLGIVVTGLAFVFLTGMVLLALMPAVVVKGLGIQVATKQTLLTFFLSYAVLFSLSTPIDELLHMLWLIVIGVLGFWLVLEMCKPSQHANNNPAIAVLAAFAVAPLFPALSFMQLLASNPAFSAWKDLIFVTTLLLFVLANAAFIASSHLKGLVRCLIVFFAAIAAFAVILSYFAPNSTVPNWAAAQLGIRLKGTSELVVRYATCKTIVARATKATTPPTTQTQLTECEEFGNHVKADVKVRSGKSWLVCVREVNGTPISKPFTMTIPSKDTELLVPNKTEKAKIFEKTPEKDAACSFSY